MTYEYKDNVNEILSDAISDLEEIVNDLENESNGITPSSISVNFMGTADMVEALTDGKYDEVNEDSAELMYKRWDRDEYISEGGDEESADIIDEWVEECYENSENFGKDLSVEIRDVNDYIKSIKKLV